MTGSLRPLVPGCNEVAEERLLDSSEFVAGEVGVHPVDAPTSPTMDEDVGDAYPLPHRAHVGSLERADEPGRLLESVSFGEELGGVLSRRAKR